jgi:hypothetical protein
VKLSIPVPVLRTIRTDYSRPVIPVIVSVPVADNVPAVLELASSFEEGLNKPV